jgi:hypothetical protein
LVGACGSSNGNGDEMAEFAGTYAVIETFRDQTGTQCGNPPGIEDNTVRMAVDKNTLEAVFTNRWGTLNGQIQPDRTFIVSGSLSAGESLSCTGTFTKGAGAADGGGDLFTFVGLMRDIRQGCTRQFDLEGEKRVP